MTRVVGIDPGPTPGIAVLEVTSGRLEASDVLQCSARLLWTVLPALTSYDAGVLVVVERFVVRGRATAEQTLTRDQVAAVQTLHPRAADRSASQVKAWATDERLERAGLLDACKGMRHARDAARHALYAAVHGSLIPDPLSKEWNR
jgi:hypothetical protein